MAAELARNKLVHGWDVLLEVAGRPYTVTFSDEPTSQQLAEAIDRIERELTDQAEVEQVIISEETDDGV